MNIIVYVLDSLRADHLSSYGYERETTPNIDAIADDGVLFERCFSPSTYTRAASASMLTGLSPLVHGTQHISDGFAPPHPTVGEKLQQAGHETAAIGSLPNMQDEWGFGRGFDQYIDLFDDDAEIRKRREQTDDDRPPLLIKADDITRGFREWHESRNSPESPFFTLLWSMETHTPFFPPDEYQSYTDSEYDGPVDGDMGSWKDIETAADHENLVNLYDGTIRYNDDCLADLCDYLRENDEYEDTLLIVCGDHGEAFGEHDGQYGHGRPPYESVTHVPLIIRPPDSWGLERGHRVSELTSLLDIAPTLIDLAPDVTTEDQLWRNEGQGRPLTSAIGVPPNADHEFEDLSYHDRDELLISVQTTEVSALHNAVRTEDWKFIHSQQEKDSEWILNIIRRAIDSGRVMDILRNPLMYYRRHYQSDGGDGGRGELYHIPTDPDEQTDLSGEELQRRGELDATLSKLVDVCDQLRSGESDTPDIDIEGEAKDRLQRLGYLQE